MAVRYNLTAGSAPLRHHISGLEARKVKSSMGREWPSGLSVRVLSLLEHESFRVQGGPAYEICACGIIGPLCERNQTPVFSMFPIRVSNVSSYFLTFRVPVHLCAESGGKRSLISVCPWSRFES